MNVTRKADRKASIYHPGGNYWTVEINGESIEVANYGGGPVAMGMCFQKGESQEAAGRAAEAAVNKFMGW